MGLPARKTGSCAAGPFTRVAGAARQYLLVEEPDADQHGPKADEGQRPQEAFEIGHVDQEDLEHRDEDENG